MVTLNLRCSVVWRDEVRNAAGILGLSVNSFIRLTLLNYINSNKAIPSTRAIENNSRRLQVQVPLELKMSLIALMQAQNKDMLFLGEVIRRIMRAEVKKITRKYEKEVKA